MVIGINCCDKKNEAFCFCKHKVCKLNTNFVNYLYRD